MDADIVRHNGELLCVPDVSAHILAEVQNAAQSLEKLCGFPAVVVHNPYCLPIGTTRYTFNLLVCVSNASREKERACAQCIQEYDLGELLTERTWGWLPSLVREEELNSWFAHFQNDPDSFPLSNAAAGACLISPVLWGDDLMASLRRRAQDYFGGDILPRWVQAAHLKNQERQARIRAIEEKCAREKTERIKLLNKPELDELRDCLTRFLAAQPQNPYDIVVGLDGSGRPIAKAIGWVADDRVKVMFLDPHHLKALHRKAQFGLWLHDILAKEMPELYYQLRQDPDKVLFVDDQTGYGGTASSLRRLVQSISGREDRFHILHMSPYMGSNLPSWHRRRDLQGIETVEAWDSCIQFTFLSLEKPTTVSETFYDQLKQHVLSWRLPVAV